MKIYIYCNILYWELTVNDGWKMSIFYNKCVFSQCRVGFRAQVTLQHLLISSFPTKSSRTILILFLCIVNMAFSEPARQNWKTRDGGTKPATILLKFGIWIFFCINHSWVKDHTATQHTATTFFNFEVFPSDLRIFENSGKLITSLISDPSRYQDHSICMTYN